MLETLSETAKELVNQINSEAKQSKTIQDLCDEALIPQGIEIPKPELIFALDDIPLFTKKSLSTLIGRAKSGKTTCTAWIMAKVISEKLNVLWIDTEQGQYYASLTQSWVLKIAAREVSPFLKFFDLKIHNPAIRIQIVELLIEQIKPDIIVIDGVRDLVFDINNPEEATIITGNLMRWADVHNCHILSIIHQNKGNEHARGHLGTEMINKSETVIKVSQDENKMTICEPEFTRGKPFPVFAFQRDSFGLPYMVNYVAKITGGESNSRKTLPIDIASDTHYLCLHKAFESNIRMTYQDLLPSISAAFEYYGMAMGVVKCKSFIQFYTQNKYLLKGEKEGTKVYYSIIQEQKKSIGFTPYSDGPNNDECPF